MSNKPKVLLVDDEAHLTRALQAAFRRQPFDVLVADSAMEAIGILTREQIEVLITDEMMPGMLGSELIVHSRRLCPDTVRIILTGQASTESAIRALNDGRAFRFLLKPFSPEMLAEVIAEALATRRPGAAEKPTEEAQMITALEGKYPGLTQVSRTHDGSIVLNEEEEDVASIIAGYR